MKKILLIAFIAGTFTLSSCDIINDLAGQVQSVANLRNCEFSMKNVSNVTIADVNVKDLTQGKLSATDIVKLVAAYQSKKVPMAMNVNMGVKNPTQQKASMTALDWILAIDGTDIANGVSKKSYTIRENRPRRTILEERGGSSEEFRLQLHLRRHLLESGSPCETQPLGRQHAGTLPQLYQAGKEDRSLKNSWAAGSMSSSGKS